MKGLAELTKTTLIGGLLIVLPIYLSVLLLAKTLSAIVTLLSPVTATIPAGVLWPKLLLLNRGRALTSGPIPRGPAPPRLRPTWR